MLTGYDASLEGRLKLAEQAESEVTRLQPLAGEAPQLRAEKIKIQKARASGTGLRHPQWIKQTKPLESR